MPTTLPRIATVLERPAYKAVECLAKKDGVSLSQKARDLILEALELAEDADLASVAEKRAGDIGDKKTAWISHAEMKRRLGIK